MNLQNTPRLNSYCAAFGITTIDGPTNGPFVKGWDVSEVSFVGDATPKLAGFNTQPTNQVEGPYPCRLGIDWLVDWSLLLAVWSKSWDLNLGPLVGPRWGRARTFNP